MTEKETDPVMETIKQVIEKFGGGSKDWFRSQVADIIRYRREVKREDREPDLTTLFEKLAEIAAIDTARQKCIQAKIVYFKARRQRYQAAQNPEMAKSCEIVMAVLEGTLPETNPNVEQNEKALLAYLRRETAKAIEQTR